MNLSDYFQQQKTIHMSDTEKLDLYQDFMLKNMKGHYSRKRSFLHVKSFVYSLVIVFLLFGFYGVYFFSDRYAEYEGLITNEESVVQADYIAKVVDFNGSFYIEHNGKRVQTSTIQDSDIVTLKENTQLVFNINTDTKAKLIGPAQFSILKIGISKNPQYKLNVLYGDFIQLKQENTKDNIQINLQDIMSVQQANGKVPGGGKPIDFQLIKAGSNHIVKNNGGSLLVTTIGKDQKEIKTNLSTRQILAFQKNDITLFDNIDKFTKAMKTKDISQTFTFTAKDTQESVDQSGIQETITEVPLVSLLTTKDEEIDQDVSSQLENIFSTSQKVITPDQNQTIRSTLTKDFLLNDLKQLYMSILKGDEKETSIGYSNIEKRIQQLYTSFELKYPGTEGTIQNKLSGLKQAIATFISSVSANYMIPPKYFDSLYTLNNRLEYLRRVSYGSSQENAQENRENLTNTLPKNLLF